MKNELNCIRNALEEHLAAINENTSEIQALFDYLQELENKFEKISTRLDQMQLGNKDLPTATTKPNVSPLNTTEKKIFLTLYTEESPLSYREIAEKTKLACSMLPEFITTLTLKGIPLLRSFCNDQVFVKIDPQFKEMQAKENLINLSLQSFME